MTVKIYITLILLMLYNLIVGKFKLFLMFYCFIIMHELSHMIIALLLNVDIIEISFMPVGVSAKYSGKISSIKELLISIAGPISSLAFAFLYHNNLYFIINIFILILNCIPIYPLDGGRVLRVILKCLFGDKKGNSISTYLTNILLIMMLLIAIFIAAYFRNFLLLLFTAYIFRIARNEIEKEKIMNVINYLQIDK